MTLQALLLPVTHLLVPALFARWLWRPPCAERLSWLVRAVSGASYVLFVFITGAWSWLGVPMRYAVPVLYLIAVAASYRRWRGLPWRAPGGPAAIARQHGGNLALSILFLGMSAYAASGYRPAGEAVELAFPLPAGRYAVGQGGDNRLINQHNGHPSQRHALDVVALDGWGTRAAGLYPGDLPHYRIFGVPVLSPCAGTVVAAHDGLPDNRPPATDRAHPAGNHVVLDCGGTQVLLAHFAQGSVAVRTGEPVAAGQPLGAAGNSGNSTEPHLHVHAFRGAAGDFQRGEPLPMTFSGRFLVRNSVVAVRPR